MRITCNFFCENALEEKSLCTVHIETLKRKFGRKGLGVKNAFCY